MLPASRDGHMGRAIGLLHERAEQAWTVDQLGRQESLSRSALRERFVRPTTDARRREVEVAKLTLTGTHIATLAASQPTRSGSETSPLHSAHVAPPRVRVTDV